ncbi:unnamed protein product [Larinioides sclopetarius]|uniref:Uncharacterized protein n=1 Tax=Larinioides sclopetarius TaxID=280406 RepID=A0AAV2BCA6_9ARAC
MVNFPVVFRGQIFEALQTHVEAVRESSCSFSFPKAYPKRQVMELSLPTEKILFQVIATTSLLLILFPLRSTAFACLTCLFPIFHPLCCAIVHTCCKMDKEPAATPAPNATAA